MYVKTAIDYSTDTGECAYGIKSNQSRLSTFFKLKKYVLFKNLITDTKLDYLFWKKKTNFSRWKFDTKIWSKKNHEKESSADNKCIR